uniref:transmembrane and coiled-coil domain-containing protein 4 isoform X2 n=1 Tax=Podarcis muralis TaxID=64176 RepID=UPI0010A099FE|nr:transmembrane and coiled-coil domain-containing protein 4 isoform X2 [Podarcis muralis]
MAANRQQRWRPWGRLAQPQPEKEEVSECVGRQLGDPGKFAYAALCAVSLASLFPEEEERPYRTGFVESLVEWLQLSDAVLPAMLAFVGGLGGEGTETFAQIVLKEPLMKDDPSIITQDLVSFSLKDGGYDARARVLLSHITWLLRIPPAELEASEERLLECLKEEEEEEESETAAAARKKKEKNRRLKRYLLIGLATVGGGTVIGLTGGLAAPLVATGATAIIGSAGAAALGSVAGMAVMGSLFGAAGAGLTGYKMKKRVGAIEEFEFLPLTEGRQLHLTIAITGWLTTGKYGSFTAPWSSLLQSKEQYCLAWESIVTALALPASLLTVASVIDNPWGVCLHRSSEVGKHLARILLSRHQGKRPVTLIGFSLGARVIYFCLQEMAKEEDCRGIVEDVVLLGAPVEGEAKYWKQIAKVVSGRIINGYCRGDWLLRYVYRTSSVQLNVAGLQPVNLDDRRMVNVDLSSIVSGHLDYMKQMDTILKAVGVKTKQCRLEEEGSLTTLSTELEEDKEPVPCDAQEEQCIVGEEGPGGTNEGDVNGDDRWVWEPVSSHSSGPNDLPPPAEAVSGQGEISSAARDQDAAGLEEPFPTSSSHSQELSSSASAPLTLR